MSYSSFTKPRERMKRGKKPLSSADTAERRRRRERLHAAKAQRGPTLWDLIKEAQSKTARVVKMRDGHVCQQGLADNIICEGIVDAGHFYPKSKFPSVRFDLANVHAQCRNHNTIHIGQPHFMRLWMIDRFGYDKVEELHARAVEPHKFTREELLAIIAERDEQIAIYELTRAA